MSARRGGGGGRAAGEGGRAGRGAACAVASGLAGIAILLLAYSRYQDPEILVPGSVEAVERIAYAFYVLLALALGAVAYGMRSYHRQKAAAGRGGAGAGLVTIIALATRGARGRRVWAATFAAYGVFFSLASGTLVYQPEVSFSQAYGADIPSGFVAPCCGGVGYMPTIVVYLTEHVGLQVVPINMLLQIAVSYLVALNASMAVAAAAVPRRSRGAGTVGAAAGLFIACPTCAGTFLSLFVGTAGGLGAALAIAQMQTAFIAVTVPVLLATPLVMARKMRGAGGACGAAIR